MQLERPTTNQGNYMYDEALSDDTIWCSFQVGKKWRLVNKLSEITAKQHTKMCLCKCLRLGIGYTITQSGSIFVQHCLVLQIDLSSLSLMSSVDRSLLLRIHP